MEEATEIARLRLFLALVASAETALKNDSKIYFANPINRFWTKKNAMIRAYRDATT
ncbi:MAG: hypothetical protein ABFS56_25035 [Pseudomonadota bacterium]